MATCHGITTAKRCKDCSFCNFKIWFGFQRCHSKSGLTKDTNYESMECCTQGVQWTLSMQHDGCQISCQWDCCKLYVLSWEDTSIQVFWYSPPSQNSQQLFSSAQLFSCLMFVMLFIMLLFSRPQKEAWKQRILIERVGQWEQIYLKLRI